MNVSKGETLPEAFRAKHSVLKALLQKTWYCLFLRNERKRLQSGYISFIIFELCYVIETWWTLSRDANNCVFYIAYLNMLIRAYSLIRNKVTRSFNMVLLGGINNSSRYIITRMLITKIY